MSKVIACRGTETKELEDIMTDLKIARRKNYAKWQTKIFSEQLIMQLQVLNNCKIQVMP